MGLLQRLIYKIFQIDVKDSVDSTIEDSDFIVKIPLRGNKVGRFKLTLDLDHVSEYFEEHPEGGKAFMHDEKALFGDPDWGARMPPRSCSMCGGIGVDHNATAEYESRFFVRKKSIGLCSDCEEYTREIIFKEFIDLKPELFVVDRI